jgi:hypothetical protein
MGRPVKAESKIYCYYSDKVVDMAYVPTLKMRFHLACMRVTDNTKSGYVLDGEKLYFVSTSSHVAKIVLDVGERVRVLAEIAARMPV